MKTTLWFAFYFLVLALYALFSFSLTDPNLVLTTWSPYWNFQQWMWQTFFSNHQLLAQTYFVLLAAALVGWYGLLKSLPTELGYKRVLVMALCLGVPLLFSYNALSHDVFNYIFNAKMIMVYGEDPHVQVALDHSDDLWTRFMHNTHTPAPYGYGWTVFSLLPYSLGFGKFLLTWLAFRGLNFLAVPILFVVLMRLAQALKAKVYAKDFAALFFHPLFLIEVLSNNHNDLWMLIPAVASMWVLFKANKKPTLLSLFLSLVLLCVSISTKMATIVLLPFWLLGVWRYISVAAKGKQLPAQFRRVMDTLYALSIENFGIIASILLFVPLFSSRSQLFHPWYLLWAFIWLPLIGVKWWRVLLFAFAISSLFRYVPWLLAGGFEGNVLQQQQAVTWLGGLLTLGLLLLMKAFDRKHES